MRIAIGLFIWGALLISAPLAVAKEKGRVKLGPGSYVPFFNGTKNRDPVEVGSFEIDKTPVSNLEYLKFVKENPQWQRGIAKKIFADVSYLKHWKSATSLNRKEDEDRPVVNVSWFSAKAYCEWKGLELPTTDQWEFALVDQNRHEELVKTKILSWYSRPNSSEIPKVGEGYTTDSGVSDLIGVIWEWTLDFNAILFGSENRSNGTKDENLFCGAGSLGAMDSSDYAKFMRYSMRAALKASYTTSNLGFRCVNRKESI